MGNFYPKRPPRENPFGGQHFAGKGLKIPPHHSQSQQFGQGFTREYGSKNSYRGFSQNTAAHISYRVHRRYVGHGSLKDAPPLPAALSAPTGFLHDSLLLKTRVPPPSHNYIPRAALFLKKKSPSLRPSTGGGLHLSPPHRRAPPPLAGPRVLFIPSVFIY